MASKATVKTTTTQACPQATRQARLLRFQAIHEALASGRPLEETLTVILSQVAALLQSPPPIYLYIADGEGVLTLRHTLPAQDHPGTALAIAGLPATLQRALAAGKPCVLRSPSPLFPTTADGPQMMLPVHAGGQLLAVATAALPKRALLPSQVEELHLLASETAVALRQAQARALHLAAEQQEREGWQRQVQALTAANHRLEALNQAARIIAHDLDLEYVLGAILSQAMATMHLDAAALFLASESHEEYVIRAQKGVRASYAARARISAADVQPIALAGAGPVLFSASAEGTPAWALSLLAASRTQGLGVVPLHHGNRLFGLLALLSRDEAPWTQAEQREMAAALGLQVAGAVVNAEHHRETELGAAESVFLLQISQLLSATLNVDAILQTLVSEASDLMDTDICALYLYDPVAQEISLAVVQGIARTAVEEAGLQRVPLAQLPVIVHAATEGRPVTGQRPGKGDLLSLFWPAFHMQAALTVPLRARGSLLGFLFLCRKAVRRFTLAETQLGLKLGTLAALALDNAHLYADQKEQMKQLKAAQAQLIEAEKMASLGRIVAGVAHELNNPLAIISGYAQVLLDDDDVAPEVRADLERIDRGARRAAQVVRDLLAFARQQPITPISINVADLLRSVAEREQPALEANGIALRVEIPENLPPICGDRFQIEQVLRQLVGNAQHAVQLRPDTAGRVSLCATYQDHVRLTVSDNGPGIPPDLLDKIFEPFLTAQELGQGAGLGLSMCYGVVRAHGGRIWAGNNPDGGATFYIEFPPATSQT